MGFSISDKSLSDQLNRNLANATREHADALEKLSSGQVFTSLDPRPSERAVAEGLEYRLRSINAGKRNVNDAISLLQTADEGLNQVHNIVIRMKELNVSGASTTVTDQERRFLFLEYQALHDEVDRIARTTNFNGLPVLNGQSPEAPDELIFRIDDPFKGEGRGGEEEDLNAIHFRGMKAIVATPAGLGLKSAKDLLTESNSEEGINTNDVQDLMTPENDEQFATVYDQAINTLATQRAVFGAMQSRLQRSMDFMDVYQENIAAAKSKIADTDYADQMSRLTHNKILMSATSALMGQANFSAQLGFELITGFGRG